MSYLGKEVKKKALTLSPSQVGRNEEERRRERIEVEHDEERRRERIEHESELLRVINHAPWTIANAHVVVKQWPPHLTWEQVDMSKSCIWVQAHGLPLNQLNEENARRIGDAFSGMLDFEIKAGDALNTNGILYVKIAFPVDKPLITGFNNIFSEEEKTWVKFKYEQLCEVCWFCGRMGHFITRCWLKKEDDVLPVYEIPEMGYGPWLHATIPEKRMYVLEPLKELTQPSQGARLNPNQSQTRPRSSKQAPQPKQRWVPMNQSNRDSGGQVERLVNIEPQGAGGDSVIHANKEGSADEVSVTHANKEGSTNEVGLMDGNTKANLQVDWVGASPLSDHMPIVNETPRMRKTDADVGLYSKKQKISTDFLIPSPIVELAQHSNRAPPLGEPVELGQLQQALALSLSNDNRPTRKW
ncbi:hypothetical protein Tsubulata_048973, partial [Turnera subulata]